MRAQLRTASAELQEHREILAKEQAEADEAASAFDREEEKAVEAERALKEARAALKDAQNLLRQAEAADDDRQVWTLEQGEVHVLNSVSHPSCVFLSRLVESACFYCRNRSSTGNSGGKAAGCPDKTCRRTCSQSCEGERDIGSKGGRESTVSPVTSVLWVFSWKAECIGRAGKSLRDTYRRSCRWKRRTRQERKNGRRRRLLS